MATSAQSTTSLRRRRRAIGMREDIALDMPDTRSPEFRKRIAEQIAALDPVQEAEAMAWIEAVYDFDPDWK